MKTNKINIFGHIASIAMGFLMVLSAVLVFPYILPHTHAALTPVASETTITIDTEDIVVDASINPDGTSTFFKATSNLTISTNNYSGYTLRIKAEDEDTHDKLINTLAGSYLESITEATSEQDFKDEASFIGKFGYSPSKLGSNENTDFLPAPDTTGDVLDVTSAANSGEGEENTYSISLGTKLDITIPSGEYVNTYIYEIVANSVPYLITFDENTTDTVTNMPSTQQDDTAADGIELDSTTPERAHYDFLGWCEGTTTNTVTEQDDVYTCDGTVYQPGDTFYLNQTTNNQVNLKAMWEIHKNRLDINGRLDGSDAGNIANYGTVDVYINGNQVADDTTDYAVYWKYGTTYEVTDIKTNTGKQYDGVQTSFPLSGTIGEEYIDLRLIFSTTVYSISYTLNNGSVSPANPTTYTVETNTFTLTNPTRTGYTFKGWSGTGLTGDSNTTVTISKGSTGNRSYTANWTINRHYLDLNGWLDGASSGSISGFGTADIYVNGTQVANDVADWYQQYDYGSTYTINDIKTATGKEYKGVYSGSLTGTITGNVGVFLQYDTKQYSVQLKVTNGSGADTKTVSHGSNTSFSVSANNGYSYSSLSCTSGQSASISGNTVTTGAITNNTVCTLTYTDQTTPTISVISGHHDYYDATTLYSASFGVTGGTVSCVNQSNNNAAVSKVIDLGAIGRNTVKCTATGKNGKSAEASQTIYVDLSRTGNQMNYTTGQCGSYVSGTSLYLKQKCSAGFDWQFGPYVTARAGSYKVTYYVYNMREDGSYTSNTDITVRPTYNLGQNVLSISNSLVGTGTIYYNTTVPSGGVSNFEVTIGNNTNYQVIIYNYKIEAL